MIHNTYMSIVILKGVNMFIVTFPIIVIIWVITSYKDSIVAVLHIKNSIKLIQTTEYNNFMRE